VQVVVYVFLFTGSQQMTCLGDNEKLLAWQENLLVPDDQMTLF